MVFSEAASDANYHFRERSLLSGGTSKSIRFTHRSVRETEGAESGREAAKDFSSGARRRHAHTGRTASGEASGRRGTTRNQKISAAAFETTITRRSRRYRLSFTPQKATVNAPKSLHTEVAAQRSVYIYLSSHSLSSLSFI